MSNPNNLTSVGNFVSQSVTTSNIVCHNLNVSTALNVAKINDTTDVNLASLDTTISISGSLSALEGVANVRFINESKQGKRYLNWSIVTRQQNCRRRYLSRKPQFNKRQHHKWQQFNHV